MLTILITLVVVVGVIRFAEDISELLLTVLTIILVVGVFMGVFVPLQGYEEPVLVKEIKLVTLSNSTVPQGGTKGIFYVSISADNVYSYRYEVDDKYGISGKSYKVSTVSKNVIEVESAECEVPVLKVYNRKGKKGLFTFAVLTDETEYVFYVPEGTIIKDISLG